MYWSAIHAAKDNKQDYKIKQAGHAEVTKRTIAAIGKLIENGGKWINTALFHVGVVLLNLMRLDI